MADIGTRASVPGANDNLSAVGAVIALAERLRDRPVKDVRVLLVSTGSEESFSEGMQGSAGVISPSSIRTGPRWSASSASAGRR